MLADVATLSVLVGVLVLGEHVGAAHLAAFGLALAGLLLVILVIHYGLILLDLHGNLLTPKLFLHGIRKTNLLNRLGSISRMMLLPSLVQISM